MIQVTSRAFREVEGHFRRGRECYELTHASVVAGGVMLAGIVWEVEGTETRVVECGIYWFAMFSFYDLAVDLMKEAA